MPEVTLTLLGEQIQTLIGEVRALRSELSAMRSDIDGGLRRIVDGNGQRITALERR
jgi:hypothetical protein